MFIENIDATVFSENRSWYSLPHPKKGISTMLTLTVIQELAQAAAKSGCNQADVVGLASLGTHGLHPNPVQHQLVSTCFKDQKSASDTNRN